MLVAMLTACVLCAVAKSLMPDGPVRQVGTFICGLVLLCAVMSPLVELEWEESVQWLEDYCLNLDQTKGGLETVVLQEWKTVIEEECATYIEDKAKEMGVDCSAQVTCHEAEGGAWIPEHAVLSGVTSEWARARLTRVLETELEIRVEYTQEDPS